MQIALLKKANLAPPEIEFTMVTTKVTKFAERQSS